MSATEEQEKIFFDAIKEKAEEVIDTFFYSEKDKLLFIFLRGVPKMFTKAALKLLENESVEDFPNTSSTYKLQKAIDQYKEAFMEKHPDFNNAVNHQKIKKFWDAMSIAIDEDQSMDSLAKMRMAERLVTVFTNVAKLEGQPEAYQPIIVENAAKADKHRKEVIKELTEKVVQYIAEAKKMQVSKEWPYSLDELNSLSSQLFEKGFTETTQAFTQVFSSKGDFTCEWKKNRTALIFLFEKLYGKRVEFPDPILSFISDKFTFHGAKASTDTFYTQIGQISGKFGDNESQLKGQYLTIYRIYILTFPDSDNKRLS